MKALFLLQWQRLKREPLLIGSMMVMTIVFVLAMGGFGSNNTISVPTFFDSSVEDADGWLERLNEAEGFTFYKTDQKTAREDVALGNHAFALNIMEDNYKILIMKESAELQMLKQIVQQAYIREHRLATAAAQVKDEDFRQKVNEYLAQPAIVVKSEGNGQSEGSQAYNHKLQTLFGMTLFFSIYTIIFSLSKIAEEKRTGTMNRIILSPVKKWQIYLGHMGYSYSIGFMQILLIFLLFKYVFDFEVGERLGALMLVTGCYVFAIVALGMLMLGLVRTLEQLNAVVPIVSVSMAMIGGAFWPIEAVSNEIILSISKVVPITYAMEALKGVSMFGQGVLDVLEPIAILLLFGVLCMGIGVNLMERRA